ncbi:MAG: alternative ribosome rescue aminoacyl-tRNA hydrolase ArfB [Chloroflexota bacterium]
MISITPTLSLDEREIQEEFVRSSGPGGQNVNKVATAVQLRFDVRHSSSLPADVRERLVRLVGSRLTEDGLLIITAQRYRTQVQNRQDALDQLVELLRQATQRPKPHFKTKPTKASKQRRLESKQRHSARKQLRRSVSRSEE